MKKLFALMATLLAFAFVLTACNTNGGEEAKNEEKNGAATEDLYAKIKEEGVLKVILSPDQGKTDFLGKLTVAVEEVETLGVEKESMGVRFWWQERKTEGSKVEAKIRKGLAWVREKVSD